MNFIEAIQAGFRNYVNFGARASRSEYWWWVLFIIILVIITSLIDMAVARGSAIQPLTTIAYLATFLPGLAVSIRRLHDTDHSGWWILLGFVPLIGAIVLLVWFCSRGTIGDNRFGPDPLGGVESIPSAMSAR
jgi:uncharacterized membrane protein YhaH (DUF805 family)